MINDALLEQGWKFTTESVESWVSSFVQRRYASTSADLQQAWAILTNQSETSVYNGPRGRYFASWGNTVSGRTIPIRKHERRFDTGRISPAAHGDAPSVLGLRRRLGILPGAFLERWLHGIRAAVSSNNLLRHKSH